jgi:transcriptional regulator GlxA family with amidase domain
VELDEGMGTIGILLFDGLEELDAVGPWEVLAAWTHQWPDDGWSVTTVVRDGGLVRCAKGLVLGAEHSWTGAPSLDVLIQPGGMGTRKQLVDETYLDWIRARRADTPLLASVCTGSLVYAAAGLLRGRPATTHWASLDRLAELDPSIEVRPDDRWVDDGDVVTASGVSAGIDMALHLVDRLAGTERAREVRRYIQYDPAPPV